MVKKVKTKLKKFKKAPTVKLSRTNTARKKSPAKLAAEKAATRLKRAGKPVRSKTARKPKVAKVGNKKPYSFKLSALNPQEPKQLSETALTKKGLTLRKLIRGTPRLMINNAVDVELEAFDIVKTRSGMPAISGVAVTYDTFRQDKVKRPHKCFIIGMDRDKTNSPDTTKPVNKHTKVLVSCACESFVFTWEYANAVYGCSRIVFGNGAPPVMMNPSLAPGLCKHLVALAREAISKGK